MSSKRGPDSARQLWCSVCPTKGVLWCSHLMRTREEGAFLYNKTHGLAFILAMRLQVLHAMVILGSATRARLVLGVGVVNSVVHGVAALTCIILPLLEAFIVGRRYPRCILVATCAVAYSVQVMSPLIAVTLNDQPSGGVQAGLQSSVHTLLTTGWYIGAGPVLRVLALSSTSIEGDAFSVAAFTSAVYNAINLVRLHLSIGDSRGSWQGWGYYQAMSVVSHVCVALVAVLAARTLRWAFTVSWRANSRNTMAVPAVPLWWWGVAVVAGRGVANRCLFWGQQAQRRGTPYRYVEVERSASVPVTGCSPISCRRPGYRVVARDAEAGDVTAASPSTVMRPGSVATSRRGSAGGRGRPGSMLGMSGGGISLHNGGNDNDDDDDNYDDHSSVDTDVDDAPSGIYFGGITSAWDPAQDRGERDEGGPLIASRIQRELSGLHLASPAMRISHLLRPLTRSRDRRTATRVSTALNILLSAGTDLHSIGLTEVDEAQRSKLARRRAAKADGSVAGSPAGLASPGPGAQSGQPGRHACADPSEEGTEQASAEAAAAAAARRSGPAAPEGDYRRRLSTSGAHPASSLMMDGDLGRWIRTTLFPQRPPAAGRGGKGGAAASPVAARSLLATRRSMADLRSAARREAAGATGDASSASSRSRASIVQLQQGSGPTKAGAPLEARAQRSQGKPGHISSLVDFCVLSRSPLARPVRSSDAPTPGLTSRRFEDRLLGPGLASRRGRKPTSASADRQRRTRRRSALGVLELNATAISGTIRGLRACASFSHRASVTLPPRPSTHDGLKRDGKAEPAGPGEAAVVASAAVAGPTAASKSFVVGRGPRHGGGGRPLHRHSTTGERGVGQHGQHSAPGMVMAAVDAASSSLAAPGGTARLPSDDQEEEEDDDDDEAVAVDDAGLSDGAVLSLDLGRAGGHSDLPRGAKTHGAAGRTTLGGSSGPDASALRHLTPTGTSDAVPASIGGLSRGSRARTEDDQDEDDGDDEDEDIVEVADLRRVMPSAAGSDGALLHPRAGRRAPMFRHNHSGATLSRSASVSPPEPTHPVLFFPSGLRLPGPAFASCPHPVGGFAPEDVAPFINDGAAAAAAKAAKLRLMHGRNRRASEGKHGSMLAAVSGMLEDGTSRGRDGAGEADKDGQPPSADTAHASASSSTATAAPVSADSDRIRQEEQQEDPEARALAGRLLRSLSSSRSRRVVALLTDATDWSFDMFALADATAGRPLAFALSELMTRIGAFAIQGIDHRTFLTFVDCLEREYSFDPSRPNPYHCSTHAADVAQGCGHMLLCEANRPGEPTLDQSDAFSLVLAAAVHDFRHPGVSNLYLQKTAHPLALRYNDDSVLENFHIAEAFTLMRRPHMQVLAGLAREDRDAARHLMIRCVRATDLSKGGSLVSRFRTEIERMDLGGECAQPLDRAVLCEMIIKCADVSHPARPLPLHERWSELITAEFFAQGDEEARLAMAKSPLCDRESADLPKGQMGFIQFVVRPALSLLAGWLGADHVMEQMDANEAHWRELNSPRS